MLQIRDLIYQSWARESPVITAPQLRAARSLLGIDQRRLAELSGLSVPTILVGAKVMNGYLESLLAGELDQAGYPGTDADKADKPVGEQGYKAPTQ